MTTIFRPYEPAQDVLRVRDMLVETAPQFGTLSNWRLERWNYTRYFIATMLGDPDRARGLSNIRYWEDTVGVWEDDADGIVGVVHCEHPDRDIPHLQGEAFFQRRPGYDALLGEMLAYAEATFYDAARGQIHTYVQENDAALQAALRARGYRKDAEHPGHDAVYVIEGEVPSPPLPAGFVIHSMADDNDRARRSKAFGLGFNHPDPQDWPSVATYAELQTAPDYRPDLDLYVKAPDGEHVSFCLVWFDAANRLGVLEPVGTHPDYRRRGLARAVVMEGIRRVAEMGATEVWVGSGQLFYQAIGFEITYTNYRWIKED
jgi:ribosomal protein S18 acetylase RimI-like enzyme